MLHSFRFSKITMNVTNRQTTWTSIDDYSAEYLKCSQENTKHIVLIMQMYYNFNECDAEVFKHCLRNSMVFTNTALLLPLVYI